MPPLLRRLYGLTAFGSVIAVGLMMLILTATNLLAQGQLPVEVVPVLNWLSFSGVAALVGVAVQWGATRERMKDIGTLRGDFDQRFDRIERQIDSLFELLGTERRGLNRREFGLRSHVEEGHDGREPV